MIDVLVDLWDGQEEPWERRTVYKEGQVKIENPWINMMGCTTPSWIRDNMPESMIGGGLVRRIVFVYGDKKRQLVPYPADLHNAQEFEDEGARLVEDLCIISEMKGEYSLTPTAKTWGINWYIEHWSKRPDHMVSDRYEGYLATKQTHIHKLGMIIAAAQRSTLEITEEDLSMANEIMTSLESSMEKVFQSIGTGDASRAVMELMAYVRAYKQISSTTLWRHMMPIMGLKEFDDAGSAAVKAGWLSIRRIGSELMYCAIKEEEKK